jgi:hypothetical protein
MFIFYMLQLLFIDVIATHRTIFLSNISNESSVLPIPHIHIIYILRQRMSIMCPFNPHYLWVRMYARFD